MFKFLREWSMKEAYENKRKGDEESPSRKRARRSRLIGRLKKKSDRGRARLQ